MKSTECILPPQLMDRLAERIEAQLGLFFSAAKRRDLHKALRRMAESEDFDDEEACIDWLLSGDWDKAKTDLCALHLTIGETYFFREPRAFDLVCNYVRKKMQAPDAHRSVRIWSAGCCTGEEPYSIAMALAMALPEADRGRTSILATDINKRSLQFARAGVYRQWSFRKADTASQSRFFSEYDETRFRINDDIRGAISFAELNLAGADYPSVATDTHGMDIIFCRNVLMYFSRERAKKVIERFRRCLVDGGWLIVSPSEASSELFAGFDGHYYPDAIYFQKKAGSEAAPAPASPALPPNRVFVEHAGIRACPPVPARPKQSRPGRPPAQGQAPVPAAPRKHTGADVATVATARALANDGQVDEALSCLEQAIQAAPTNAELHQAKALIAMESGDRYSAMQSLKNVVYIQPDFILAHYLMGVIQASLNRIDEAARRFEAADELLAALADDDIVPGSDGLNATYLRESMHAWLHRED